MAKATVLQTGFSTGEISPLCFGATDNPRYKKGLEVALNYIPTLQGPLIRRPGTKFCAPVKDANNPPILVPFKFSATQNYMLEFGDGYIRFFANNGAVVTTANSYKISGGVSGPNPGVVGNSFSSFPLYATRDAQVYQPFEYNLIFSAVIPAGATLELQSPYKVSDLPLLRWDQSGDTIYFVHPNYPVYKLQRQTQTNWVIKPVYLVDGPYLAPNTYNLLGDSIDTQMQAVATTTFGVQIQLIAKASINGTSNNNGQVQVNTSAAHNLTSGQKVFITGVVGTTEINNKTLNPSGTNFTGPSSWTVTVLSTTSFLLQGSVYTNAYSSGGTVYPSLLSEDLDALGVKPAPNINRSVGLSIGGKRYWGYINNIYDAANFVINPGGTDIKGSVAIPASTPTDKWYLGEYGGNGGSFGNASAFNGRGYPSCIAFHQNRLFFAGALARPQTVDGSMIGSFENFALSVPDTQQVQDNNALSFTLSSEDQNPIRWMVSTSQGLVAATYTAEWSMTPSSGGEALTPTNFNGQRTSYFGGAAIAPVQSGNAVFYIQRAARKLREIAYFFGAGTFRSNDLTEISEHITLPGMAQLGVQKETQPLIWGRRTDGALTTLVYNREDASLSAGWTRHLLGGRGDAAGSPAIVLNLSHIPDPLVSFDQTWFVVQRYVNGAKVVYIEYLTKISDSSIAQNDSVQGDCSGVYNVPFTVNGINKATSVITTSAPHGFTTGNQVRFQDVLGLRSTITDLDGNVIVTDLINGKAFYVVALTATTFSLADTNGVQINLTTGSDYVSGGTVRKMITTISGATWLAGETVGVLTDGGIHPDVVVSPAGVITLQYPAAKVVFGYRFKSQGKVLRAEAGGADGSSIGKTRRTTRAAFQLYRTGDLNIGTVFNNLIPVELAQADQTFADTAVPLYSGIVREGLESSYDFESQICFEQNSMLPGTIQSITSFMEEFDI